MKNNNSTHSFAETTRELSETFNNVIGVMQGVTKTMVGNEDVVDVNITHRNPNSRSSKQDVIKMPSVANINNRVTVMENNFEALFSGKGAVIDKGGVTVTLAKNIIPKSPARIEDVTPPGKFVTRPNWFFEDLLFPALKISLDLKGKIEDESDRIVCKRVIVDNTSDMDIAWFKSEIAPYDMTYNELIKLLNEHNKKYWEDENVYDLPLKSNKYTGRFFITSIEHKSSDLLYYIDTISYGSTGYDIPMNNMELKIGDKLYVGESVFEIDFLDKGNSSITVKRLFGEDYPVVGGYFNFFTTPFADKTVEIGVSYNELNVLFIKGVNEKYNILSNDWSSSIPFFTNELVLDGSNTTLNDYYNRYVVDYGKMMESQAKERFIPAFMGERPNAPKLDSSNFRVVTINNQLESAISKSSIENNFRQSLSLKTEIDSLGNTIEKEKQVIINQTNEDIRKRIQNNIADYTKKLDILSTEYKSLVTSIQGKIIENGSGNYTPKYRLRGFFQIPDLLPANVDEDLQQQIIQFEIMYRYIRVDNTGTNLNTFIYKDVNTGENVTGVYSDWNVSMSKMKERVFEPMSGTYKWYSENISDGSEININQLDIPIQKGEKVEIKIRSISEAGYPSNPLKSEWSNPIIVDFPTNVESTSSMDEMFKEIKSEGLKLELKSILSTEGLSSHVSDSIPNPKKGDGIMYRHTSENICVNVKRYGETMSSMNIESMDLQSFVDNITDNIYVPITKMINGETVTVRMSLSEILTQLLNSNKPQL